MYIAINANVKKTFENIHMQNILNAIHVAANYSQLCAFCL